MLVRVVQLAVESTAGVYVCGGVGSSVWARFFADDPVTRASLQGSRLRRSGRLYSFVHKSIPEYFAACAMWADVIAVSTVIKSLKLATSAPVALSAEVVDAVGSVLTSSSGADSECVNALNRIQLLSQPAVLSFMVDMLVRMPLVTSSGVGGQDGALTALTYGSAVAGLHAIVRSSVAIKGISTASANCGSVLAQSGVSLSGAQWSGVCLKGAVLSDAVLSSASLRGADLRNSRLERVAADSADLRGANLEGVSLGQYPMMLGHGAAVNGLVLSPDGKTLASCSDDSTVRLWDLGTSACVGVLEPEGGGTKEVSAIAFYPDGSALVSAHDDSVLRTWDLTSRTCVGTVLLGGYLCVAGSIAVSPNGRVIAVGLRRDDLRVYDVASQGLAVEVLSRSVSRCFFAV